MIYNTMICNHWDIEEKDIKKQMENITVYVIENGDERTISNIIFAIKGDMKAKR